MLDLALTTIPTGNLAPATGTGLPSAASTLLATNGNIHIG